MKPKEGTPGTPNTETPGTPPETPPAAPETPPETPPAAQETPPAAPETPPAAPGAPPETPPNPGEPEVPPANAEENTPPERVVPAAEGYKFPEGVPADFGKFANSLDMTQDQANGVLNAHQSMKQAEMSAIREAGKAHIKNWGDRADYNMNLAKRAMKQHDTDGTLTKLLKESGFGNHPAVLDHFYTLGLALQEGGFLKSELKAPGEKTRAQKMFPEMKSESL